MRRTLVAGLCVAMLGSGHAVATAQTPVGLVNALKNQYEGSGEG